MIKVNAKWYWIILILGFITYNFVGGRYNVVIMTYIAPLFFLLISRNVHKVWQFILLVVSIIAATILKFPNMLDSGFPIDQIMATFCALLVSGILLVDRFLYNGFTKNGSIWRKFAGTFIAPTCVAAMEFLCSLLALGAFSGISTTQLNNLPLLQFASVVGQFGLTFIISWVSSFIYFLIEVYKCSESKKASDFIAQIKIPVSIFLIVIIGIFAFGDLRMFLTDTSSQQVKVAYAHAREPVQNDQGEWVIESLELNKEALAKEMKIAAQGGAKLVSFNEEAFYLYSDQKDDFLEFAKAQAKANKIYASLGLEFEDRAGKELSDNSLAMISPEGEILSYYKKSQLIPLMEDRYYNRGDYKIPIHNLELIPGVTSKVSSAICFEGESSTYLQQLGSDTDIHLNPSFEWKKTEELHSASIQLRAIEYGASIIQPTTINTSSIFDYLGKTVASSTTLKTGYSEVTFGYIPTKGIPTAYATCGYFLNYLFIPGLVAYGILAIVRVRKCKRCEDEKTKEIKVVKE